MFFRTSLIPNRKIFNPFFSQLQHQLPKRNYYADVMDLRKHSATAAVQTVKEQPTLAVLDRGYRFDRVDNEEKKSLVTHLDLEKVIQDRNYTDLFGVENNLIYFKSAESEISGVSDDSVDLRILYSIPQENWDAFLSSLAQPDLVKALGLNKHRHLWMGYNVVISASTNEEERLKLANFIGAYHFTLDLWITPFEKIVELFWHYRRYNPKQAQYLTTQLKIVKAKLLTEYEFSLETLQTLHPCFTSTFLRKVANCMSFDEVIRLANAILHYSADELLHPHQIPANNPSVFSSNSKALQDSTGWIVPSKSSGGNFANMISALNSQSGFSGLFFNDRKAWLEAKNPEGFDFRTCKRYVFALFQDLIVSYIFQENLTTNLNEAELLRVLQVSRYEFRKIIQNKHTPHSFDQFQKRFQRNKDLIDDFLNTQEINWLPLTETYIHGPVTIKPLVSRSELKLYSKILDNCLDRFRYYIKCADNLCDIFHLNDNDDEDSILELQHADGIYNMVQHKGFRNSIVRHSHERAAKIFIRDLNENKIPINPDRVKETKTVFESALGFNAKDKKTQEEVYRIYKDNNMLPPILRANSWQEMLVQSGMQEFINKAMKMNLQDESYYSNCDHDRGSFTYFR